MSTPCHQLLVQESRPIEVTTTSRFSYDPPHPNADADADADQEEDDNDEELSSSMDSRESQVSFGTIEFREFIRILVGEHVHVRNALSLGWEYEQLPAVRLDDFEQELVEQKEREFRTKCAQPNALRYAMASPPNHITNNKSSSSSHHKANRICSERRRRLLASFGFTHKELQRAEKDRIRVVKEGKQNNKKKRIASAAAAAAAATSAKDEKTRITMPSSSSFRSIRIIRKLIKPLTSSTPRRGREASE